MKKNFKFQMLFLLRIMLKIIKQKFFQHRKTIDLIILKYISY